MGYIPQVFTAFMGVGYVALLSLLLLLAGCWSAIREKRGLLLLCVATILAPILMSLQGVSVDTAAYARYLICSLPLLLILIAEGIDWLARSVWQRRTAIAAWGLTALIFVYWTPMVQAKFLAEKRWPYARVAKFLHTQMQKNDVVVAGWSIGFTLSQFFERPEDRILLPDQYVSKVADELDTPLKGRVFYVTGPAILNGRTTSIRQFGQAEVTIHRGKTARALLEEWREDLLHRTAGRVYAPFQNDYQLLALLEERLPSGQSADHWRSLAERCRGESPAARGIPRHLEKATRAVIFP